MERDYIRGQLIGIIMPTFKTNHTKKSGTIVQAENNPNDYIFASCGKDENGFLELRHLDQAKNKIVIDNQHILVECKNGWTGITVSNVKEDETWEGWDGYFKGAKDMTNKLIGFDDKNKKFVTAFDEDSGELIFAHGNDILQLTEEDLTMVVLQRNAPGSSSFDVCWCLQKEEKILTSVFNKKDLECVTSYLSNVSDYVYDNGADPYDWSNFLRVQIKDGGDANDWRGVFEPLTDEEEEDDSGDEDFALGSEEEDEEEEEEEEDLFDLDESETDEESGTEYDLTDASSVSSDDMEGAGFDEYESDGEFEPSLKRRRL